MEDSFLNVFKWLKSTFIVSALLLISFWTYFFVFENSNPHLSEIYLAHERAFPIPDILWIVSLLLLSMYWLKQNDIKGIISTTAAGSALVFLAMLDICFNYQQGIYTQSLGDGILNGTVNVLSLGYGLALLKVGYRLIQIRVSK